ncbi:serine protease [Rhodococcus opacus]|uniref:hypothetical protein n=1 Tax=Rhodococcus opacus TaxID=37919 RepID=UPI0002A36D78|nr:hypothetical protein [Rhodococcus opacus]ELB92684.1 serine protease [Rhodococcus wratislaviensis IFP 2016]MDX5962951.1 serine protease [Rhodococcus opacus]NKY69835.1 serine protease [Rhodococcus opacus]CAG7599730.1 hypothetical protein E143388_04784 [Rhodococcus opacus]
MKMTLVAVLAALAVTLGVAPVAQAGPTIHVGPGTAYTPYPDVEGYCSIGAVGTDNAGRLVALTVGHCHQGAGTAVYKVGDAAKGPIGWETDVYSRNTDGTFTALDYAVIRLNPDVVVPSKYSDTTDVAVSTIGDASLSNVGCNHGATTGKNCGIIGKVDGIHLQNWAVMWQGDSGGPIVVGETLVGLNIGMDFGTQPTTFYGKIMPILADINAKGSYGAGFTLVQ